LETPLKTAVKILGLKYVEATPQKVAKFEHGLDNASENKKFLTILEAKTCKIIRTLPQGELRLYESVVVLITHDKDFPIQFCFFFSEKLFNSTIAAVEDYLVTLPGSKGIKIEGLPLSTYTLFEVIFPKFKVFIGGEKLTVAGKSWNKQQMKEALKHNLHVYFTNEDGAIFELQTYEEVKKRENLLWGATTEYNARRVILAAEKL